MTFRTADHLAAHYFAMRDAIGTIPARRIASPFDARCRECGGEPTRVLIPSARPRHRWQSKVICSRCERRWRDVEERLKAYKGIKVKHLTDPDRPQRELAAQLDRIRPLRVVFEPVPHGLSAWRWDFELLCWRIYLHPQVRGAADVARVGSIFALGTRSAGDWTPMAVGRAIAHAREIVESRAAPPRGRLLPPASQNVYRAASA